MGAHSVHIADDLAEDIERLADRNGVSLEKQTDVLLRFSIGNFPQRETLAATARRIAAMTPKGVRQTPAEELLREDRAR